MNVTLRCDIFIWGEFGYGGCSCAKQRVDGENLRRFGFGLTLFVCLFVYCHTFLQGLLLRPGTAVQLNHRWAALELRARPAGKLRLCPTVSEQRRLRGERGEP